MSSYIMERCFTPGCSCRESRSDISVWWALCDAEEALQTASFERLSRLYAWAGSSGWGWGFGFRSPQIGTEEHVVIHAPHWADACAQIDRIYARTGLILTPPRRERH